MILGWRRAKKFRKEGGRGGWINFEEGERRGRLAWELSCAPGVPLAVFHECSWWLHPVEEKLTDEDLKRLVQEFATEHRVAVALYPRQGSNVVVEPEKQT